MLNSIHHWNDNNCRSFVWNVSTAVLFFCGRAISYFVWLGYLSAESFVMFSISHQDNGLYHESLILYTAFGLHVISWLWWNVDFWKITKIEKFIIFWKATTKTKTHNLPFYVLCCICVPSLNEFGQSILQICTSRWINRNSSWRWSQGTWLTKKL